MIKSIISEIVVSQLRELIETLQADEQFEVNENTILFGNGSSIDSLSLVSLIVDLEMVFSDDHEFDLSLTDDRAMTREISPFDNVNSLVDYINELINE
jgi:acyl carrier protein